MNWYRVVRPFDHFVANANVLMEPNLRTVDLEYQGFIVFLGPAMEAAPDKPKRGRRGKQVEAGPVQSSDVPDSEGGDTRPGDV